MEQFSAAKRFEKVIIPTATDGLSPAIALGCNSITGLQVLAGWTAADITFSVSYDGTTYGPFYDAYGAEVKILSAAIAADRPIALDAALLSLFAGVRFVKLRSGTTATPVQQAAARTVVLALRQV